MTVQAELIYGLSELGIVFRAVNVVTGGTTNTPLVHHALHEIVTLHAVLVRRSIGEVEKVSLAEISGFQGPIVREMSGHVIADGPVVCFSFDKLSLWLTLRVALDAGVA